MFGLGKRTRLAVVALGAVTSSVTFGCSSGDKSVDTPKPFQTTAPYAGTVAVYSATFDDGTGENQYFLRDAADKDEVRLWFKDDPNIAPGSRIGVWGDRAEDGIRVSRFDIDESLGTTRQALIDAPPYPARTFAFVLVDIGGGVNLTTAEANKRLFGTAPGDNSVKQYYDEVSYGTQPISGIVYGPVSYPMPTCDTRGMATALRAQVGTYDHYLWYMGSRTSVCSWSGLGESGRPSAPQNDTWYNGSAGCVVLVQEPGHNFGMQHSSSMTCGTAPFADNPSGSCTHNEYGDRYDPMGGGCNHMNAVQKVFQGWLQKCNSVRVGQSGTYNLQPLEPECDGIQVLQIPMPKVRPFTRSGGGGTATTENLEYYYLELRSLRGFDQTIRVAPTVLVHVAEDFRARTDRGRHTWILDMDPTTTRTIDGMGAGMTFTDPAGGVSFTVNSVSADGASITVNVPGSTGATCLDGTTYDPNVQRACIGISTGSGGSTGTGGAAGTGGGAGAGGAPSTGGATGTGGSGVALPRMEAYTLINSDSDSEIFLMQDGMYLDLDTLPPNLTMRADPSPSVVGSVAFQLDGAAVRVESISPYSLSSDNGQGDFAPWTLGLGTHTVTGTPYTAANAGGQAGEALTITFTLGRGPNPFPPDAGVTPPPVTGGATGAGGTTGAGGFTGPGGTYWMGGAGGMAGAGGGFVPPGGAGTPVGSAGLPPAVAGGPGIAGYTGVPFQPPMTNFDDGSGAEEPSSCNCRVPGGSRESGSHHSALAFGVAALVLARARRRPRRTLAS
jgi:MYXO-CTERM domain-containing protein